MARRKTFFDESLQGNRFTYAQYVDRLTELSVSMFEWKNLPEKNMDENAVGVDPRFLEMVLFSNGYAIFFKDEELGYLALKCAINGSFDVYGIPTKRRAYAINGYTRNLTNKDSVIIFNNYIHTNSVLMVRQFAKRLYNLDRIIDINANAQKTPTLIQGSEEQRLSLMNLYKEYDGNAPVIFGDRNLDVNAIKVLSTGAPYVSDKLYTLKTQIWNEALTYLGISNLNIQKKERLVSDEVTRSVGGTIASRYSRLQARREAAEQINKMFGLEIEVDFREDFREADDEVMFAGATGDMMARSQVYDIRTK